MPDWGKWFGRLKKHKVRTPPLTPAPASDVSTTIGNGLNVALRLLKEAVTGIGVPGLEATVNGVVGVIDLIKDVRDNAADLHDLNERISSLANTISMAPNLHPGVNEVPESLLPRVNGFLSELHGMLEEVQQMLLDKNPAIRAANSQSHKEAIGDIDGRITRLLYQFTAQGVLSLELDMAGARRDIRSVDKAQKALVVTQEQLVAGQDHLAATQGRIAVTQGHLAVTQGQLVVTQEHLVITQNAQEYENLINAIPRADARYNDMSTKPSRPCHPNTRTGLLQVIGKWIDEEFGTTPYFWLCGEVGVGKSTVAHTIAKEQEALKQLGASFFFSRHDETRRTPRLLFTSIAYQLARFDKGIYRALAEALKPDPDIVKRSPMVQFKQLVLEPLAKSGIDPSRTIVIVIDGLDECSDPASILDVLTLGIGNVGVRLRVLISSRPYSAILSKFEDSRLCHLTSETQFHDIDPQILSNDVAAYLSWSLGDLAMRRRLPSPWPPKDQLDELILRAAGLFIIASTYTKYIEDPEVGNPTGQLARILSRRRGVGSSPLAELDALYDQVLDDLKAKLPSAVTIARDIIANVILAPGTISVAELSGLWGIDAFDVRLVLRCLTAVILLPEDDAGSVAPFHASFGEYIQDSTRCTVHDLSIDTEAAFGRIVAGCFSAITRAANDGITGLEYSAARGYSWVPKHLEYISGSLKSYLSHCTPAQVAGLKTTLIGTAIWTLLNIHMIWNVSEDLLMLIDAVGGFEPLSHIEGSSQKERSASLSRSMIAKHVLEIGRMSESAVAEHESVTTEAHQRGRLQALKFGGNSEKPLDSSQVLRIAQNARLWRKYSHRNVMSIKGIAVNSATDPGPEVLVFLESEIRIQRSSDLCGYLKKNSCEDLTERVEIALGVADGLRYLHGTSPPQPHGSINPHDIMINEAGQPILYPSTWHPDFQSKPPPNGNIDVDDMTCTWNKAFSPSGMYHWIPTGSTEHEWQHSLEKRLQADVWDFGSTLYQVIAREGPLTAYSRLAKDDKVPGPDAKEGESSKYWDGRDHYESRFAKAVTLLLDFLEASGELKKLLKSCWTIRPQDRPPMREVFERLKAIVEDMKT